MKGMNNRGTAVPCCVISCRGYQGKCVVEVHDFCFNFACKSAQTLITALVPDRRDSGSPRLLDVHILFLEALDSVSLRAQQRRFTFEYEILSAPIKIAVMND